MAALPGSDPPFIVTAHLSVVELHFHAYYFGAGARVTRAGKACGKPGCPHLRPCPVPGHTRSPWQGSTRRAELPRGWSAVIVPRILTRDPICTICRQAPSTEVHHTGDKHDHRDQVLAGVCKDCHKSETSKQAARARARAR